MSDGPTCVAHLSYAHLHLEHKMTARGRVCVSYSGDQSAVGNVMCLFCNDKCDVAKKREKVRWRQVVEIEARNSGRVSNRRLLQDVERGIRCPATRYGSSRSLQIWVGSNWAKYGNESKVGQLQCY